MSAPGFAVISVSGLYFDVQVLWVIVMYVSAYPEIIVMRNSNVSTLLSISEISLPISLCPFMGEDVYIQR